MVEKFCVMVVGFIFIIGYFFLSLEFGDNIKIVNIFFVFGLVLSE